VIRTRYMEWTLGLLWALAAAGALAILVSLAIGAKWMLTPSSLTASMAVVVGSAIASQTRSLHRASICASEHR
jgi:ABC-type polysaccharide/polyol phosphate export permease